MKAIDSSVTAKLHAQRGQDDALALWKELWAAFEAGGVDAAREYVDGLIDLGDDGEGAAR
jgi:hypothetical protein